MKIIQFKIESNYVDIVLNLLNSINRLKPNIIKDLSILNNTQQLLSKKEINKIVENSQRIEGYEPVSKELELEVEAFMVKHNVQVSA